MATRTAQEAVISLLNAQDWRTALKCILQPGDGYFLMVIRQILVGETDVGRVNFSLGALQPIRALQPTLCVTMSLWDFCEFIGGERRFKFFQPHINLDDAACFVGWVCDDGEALLRPRRIAKIVQRVRGRDAFAFGIEPPSMIRTLDRAVLVRPKEQRA